MVKKTLLQKYTNEEKDEIVKVADDIYSWLVCAAIASNEDMAQGFEHFTAELHRVLKLEDI